MSCIGVITGDIVNSTDILRSEHRDKLLDVMKNTVKEINSVNPSYKIKMEIYRGDSFQVVIKNPVLALKVAIIIRAALIANSESNVRWDARLGIGIGESEFISDSVAESDGEAFHKSGQEFDNLNKNSRMVFLQRTMISQKSWLSVLLLLMIL